MRTSLLVTGIFCLIVGLVWLGQGTGYFPYPKGGFMVGASKWAYYGGALALIGAILTVSSRQA